MTIIPNFNRPCVNRHHDTYKTVDKDARKSEIIALINDGLTRQQIAEALGISITTLGTRMNRYGIRFKRHE